MVVAVVVAAGACESIFAQVGPSSLRCSAFHCLLMAMARRSWVDKIVAVDCSFSFINLGEKYLNLLALDF